MASEFRVSTKVGISGKYAGDIMDKHVYEVLDKQLGPAAVQRLNMIVKSWSRPPAFSHSVAKLTSEGMWELQVKLAGEEGTEYVASKYGGRIKVLKPASLFRMIDEGREAGRIIKPRVVARQAPRQMGHTISSVIPIYRGGRTEAPPLRFRLEYSPKTMPGGSFALYALTGGGVRSGSWISSWEVKQGAIKPRDLLEAIRGLAQANAYKFARRGYNRALREIMKTKRASSGSK